MKFFSGSYSGITYPCITLSSDNWDDYGHKTTYHLKYYENKLNSKMLGTVKILKRGYPDTYLPHEFSQLSEEYCSLGQGMDFYESLFALGESVAREVLTALNDVALFPDIGDSFKEDDGFNSSLLRFSEAEKIYREGLDFFGKRHVDKLFSFQFTALLPNAGSKHIVKFDFSKLSGLPSRIHAIIGKNGTGKTQLLAAIANAMSGQEIDAGDFLPYRPSFSRVIAVSYSVFDTFKRPKRTESFSYHYCGIKTSNNTVSFDSITTLRTNLIPKIKESGRWNRFCDVLNTLLDIGEDVDIASMVEADIQQLSSGQNILFNILLEIVSYIQPESLILFDEPETHLHPDAIAHLVNALYVVAEEFDSYVIIATHSPIIIQQIPSRCVQILYRIGTIPYCRQLTIECLGENLTAITDDVFGASSTEMMYIKHFRELADHNSYSSVISLFDTELSFNAKITLRTLIDIGEQ